MNILLTKKTSESLINASKEIISIFTKTVSKLEQVNKESEELQSENCKRINELTSENENLTSLISSNKSIITKLIGIVEPNE